MHLPAEALSPTYLLLAQLFLKEADADLLRELSRPDIATVLDKLEPGCAAQVEDALRDDAARKELAAEYEALFLLPEGVTPFAVGWIEGDEGVVRADLADRITVLYESLRIEPVDFGLGNVPADHIGMMLALVAVAYQTEPDAGDAGLAGRAKDLIRSFAPAFAKELREKARSPLYRAAAHLLVMLLEPA